MSTTAAPALRAEARLRSGTLPLVALVLAGAVATAFTVLVVDDSAVLRDPGQTALLKGLFVASYVAVGAYTLWRRPASRLGPLVTGAGFLYTLTALQASSRPLLFTLGRLAIAGMVVYLLYLFLCFPRDRVVSDRERRFIRGFAVLSAVVWAVVLALVETLPRGGPYTECAGACPTNPLQVVSTSEGVTSALNLVANGFTAFGIVAVLVHLVRKARSPLQTSPAITPLVAGIVLLGVCYSIYSLVGPSEVQRHGELRILTLIGALAVPAGLLVGQIRGRLLTANRLPQLVRDAQGRVVTTRWIQQMLRDAVGDPQLLLGVWDPAVARYVGADSDPLELPTASEDVTVTKIDQDNAPTLVLVHRASFEDDPDVLESFAVTAAMLLENASLVERLRASRARIVESGDRERRRLERDLHDGAQQRLVAIQAKLALAEERADQEQIAELRAIASDVAAAVEDLRTLAQGIYPTVLRERGLGDALRSAATVAPIPVRVHEHGVGRCSSAVEAAVYFCSLEAIQNAAKHAGPDAEVTVSFARKGDRLEFEVRDDGAGFEPNSSPAGIGLVSMRDRIGAVGGTLRMTSSPGRGTQVAGNVPAHEPVAE